ncbi:MAG: HTTM domain-containing protein [Myxococcales bacterium]|nr:HTTM domain-containing protein [Myxococcales bacterium]
MTHVKLWDIYFYQPLSVARVFLFVKNFYAVIALDIWVLMLSHGARYRGDEFNVAHFAWLDALPWRVSPALYVGVMLAAGLCAFFVACSPFRELPRLCVFLLYTYGWSMSMLDSYQHHYFLSLILFCRCFIPGNVFLGDIAERKQEIWPFRMMTLTVALLYLFAALGKLESGWRDGRLLSHMIDASAARWLSPLRVVLGENMWPVMAGLVITTEALIGLGYLVVPWLSSPLRWVTLALAIGVHVGIEIVGLRIGWFSSYMMLLATWVFVPSAYLHRGYRVFVSLRSLVRLPYGIALLGLIAAVGLAMHMVALPGAPVALGAFVVLLAGFGLYDRGNKKNGALNTLPSAGFLSTLALLVAIGVSDARFDYYRYAGKDAERKGELKVALSAYTKAERYAPAGKSRAHKIQTLKKRLSVRGRR